MAAPVVYSTFGHGVATVVLAGECDLAVAAEVRALVTAVEPGAHAVCVDLSSAEFIDSTILAALIAGYRAAQEAGRAYSVTGAHGSVLRVLQVSGVANVLCVQPTTDSGPTAAG